MSTEIDISGLNRDDLLRALWNRSKPASFYLYNNFPAPPFDLSKKTKSDENYVDYFCGRVIKANIYSSDTVDPWAYDRDVDDGAFASVVANLRNNAT